MVLEFLQFCSIYYLGLFPKYECCQDLSNSFPSFSKGVNINQSNKHILQSIDSIVIYVYFIVFKISNFSSMMH